MNVKLGLRTWDRFILKRNEKKSMKKSKKALYITIKSVTKQKFIKTQICIHAMWLRLNYKNKNNIFLRNDKKNSVNRKKIYF